MRRIETYREAVDEVTEVYCGFDRMTATNRRFAADQIADSDAIEADSLLIFRTGDQIRVVAFPVSTLGIPWIRLEDNGRLLTAGIWYDGLEADSAKTATPLVRTVEHTADAFRLAAHRTRRATGHRGWCSWYQFFTGVTEEIVLDTVRRAESVDGLSVIQIDMGYSSTIGDWLTPGDGFSRSITEVVADIGKAGFVPGVWLAPFTAEEDSDLYRSHPDWFYADDTYPWKKDQPPWKCLDLSVPDAIESVVTVVRALHEAGARYFKLDFIDMALVEGARRSPDRSGVELYRQALSAIRSAAPDSFILGCNPAFSATVDLLDGVRVGEDTAPRWLPKAQSAASAFRSLETGLGRTYLRQAAEIDLDCMLLRQEKSDLTRDEINTVVNAVIASGEQRFVSDDLSLVDAANINRAFRRIDYPERFMLPARPLDENIPSDFEIYQGSQRVGKLLCNWGDGEICIVPFLVFGREASEYRDSETGRPLARGEICLKPHQSLLALRA